MTNVNPISESPAGKSDRVLDTHLLVGVLFAASIALGDYGIRFFVDILHVTLPSQIIAGFIEPLLTKLVPALAIVWIHQWKDVPLEYLMARPYWFAFVGGLSLGLIERILYLVVKNAAISPAFLIVPSIHILNAVLIAGLIFSSADRLHGIRFFSRLVSFTILAIGIHLFWNTLGVELVHQYFSF